MPNNISSNSISTIPINDSADAASHHPVPQPLTAHLVRVQNINNRYEVDDPNMTHYGRSNVDNPQKIVLDSVSYLSTKVFNQSGRTVSDHVLKILEDKMKSGQITFSEIEKYAKTSGDLQAIRIMALRNPIAPMQNETALYQTTRL